MYFVINIILLQFLLPPLSRLFFLLKFTQVEIKQYNEVLDREGKSEKDYLSIGNAPLPNIYIFVSIFWCFAFVVWVMLMCIPGYFIIIVNINNIIN